MSWQVIVALVVMLPVILIPAAFVWYLNIGGVSAWIRAARARRVPREETTVAATAEQKVAE